jgi:hypothetical protein
MSRGTLAAILAGLVLAVGIAASAWHFRGVRDASVLALERSHADSAAALARSAHAAALDSIAGLERDARARAARDSARADTLRRRAASSAAAARASHTELAAARTANDSLPIVLSQRDRFEQAFEDATLADSTARLAAREELASVRHTDSLKRAADARLADARIQQLEARNAELAQTIARLQHPGLDLGLFRVPRWVGDVVRMGAAGVAGYCLAGGC